MPAEIQEIFNDKNMDIDEPLSKIVKHSLSISHEESVKQDNEKKTKTDYRKEYIRLIKIVNSSLGKEKTSSIEQEILGRTQPTPAEIEEGVDYKESILKLKDNLNSLFSDKQKEINYLEQRVEELTKLIKERKEKIVNIFSRLLPDKEKEINLIQKLIVAHLEFIRATKQKLPSVQLRKQRDKIRDELEGLLGD